MRSTAARVALLGALATLAVVLFVVLSGDDDGETTGSTETRTTGTTTQPAPSSGAEESILVKDGQPVGGVAEIDARKGERVSFEVELDRPEEEVHVHGYEITEPARRSPVRVSFPAAIDGLFEVELHRSGGDEVQIAELRVNP